MAQNITLMGASYTGVPAVTLPKTGGGTARFDDATVTTATAADVASGKVFLASDGTITTGTASGGGSSSWTKVCEKTYSNVSTTSGTASTVETWETGHSELWDANKLVYVRIRDTDGRKNNYFFGSDNIFFNSNAFASSSGSTNISGRVYLYETTTGLNFIVASGTTGYGVFADQLYSDGRLRIRDRYSSTYKFTINGTYKVEVYTINYPIPFYQ